MKKNQLNVLSFLLPLLAAVIAGWYWRTPNITGLSRLRMAGSEWRKELTLERMRLENMELWGNDYFTFNFLAGVIAGVVVFFAFRYYAKKKGWLQEF